MLLYSPLISARLQFITDFIGRELTGKSFQITEDLQHFENYTEAKINYSEKRKSNEELWIIPHTLLNEKKIQSQQIDCFEWNGSMAFFKTGGDCGFDIFAASFYLLSRYEEYLPHTKDIYGRYGHENSLAYKENFLHLPLVNRWLKNFKQIIHQKFPAFPITNGSFQFLPTYDIDEAFSYKYKSFSRNAGAIVKAIVKGELRRISDRKDVITGKKKDPFDSYEWMDALHAKYKLSPRYFFLLAEQTGRYDRNILPATQAMQQLIKKHAAKYTIGIHPSWQSGDDTSLIKKEIILLEKISGKKINSSRQHFIRMNLPRTYRHLIDAGITEDFSMGYGSINGFRASVASPFYWYDLEREQATNLLLYPFCYMEANSFFEQHFSPAQAAEELQLYYKEVKEVNGLLITLWHNTFLGTDPLFNGWKEVYEEFIEKIINDR